MGNLLIALGAGVIALLFAAYTARKVLAEDEGTDLMKEIAKKGRGPKALPNLTAFSTIKIAELLHKVLTE